MRRALSVSCLLLLAVYVCLMNGQQAPRSTVFEGARLIVGDGTVIEDSAFIMEGTQFSRAGRRGQVQIPAGAVRVDLSGKTVIPTKVDVHGHIGAEAASGRHENRARQRHGADAILHRLDGATRIRELGMDGPDSDGSRCCRDARLRRCGSPQHRIDRARQKRRLHGAGCESARKHCQFPEDQQSLPSRAGSGPCQTAREVASPMAQRLTLICDGGEHHAESKRLR